MTSRELDTAAVAHKLCVSEARVRRLVKEGAIPAPHYALGPRSPRWDESTLNEHFKGGIASTKAREAFNGLAEKILKEGRKGRPSHTC